MKMIPYPSTPDGVDYNSLASQLLTYTTYPYSASYKLEVYQTNGPYSVISYTDFIDSLGVRFNSQTYTDSTALASALASAYSHFASGQSHGGIMLYGWP